MSPIFIFGVLLAIVGVWWALQTEPADPAPGCRFVGKFQQCETPSPHDTPAWSEPAPYDDDPFGP